MAGGFNNIAALQPQPAPRPKRGRVVHQARCSTGTLLYLVTPPEDASMMSSRVNIFHPTQNTRVRINVLTGKSWVDRRVRVLTSAPGMRSCVDPISDVLLEPLSTTCQPSLSDIIVIMIMTPRKYKILAPLTFWTEQTKISQCPASPAPRVSTTQQL